MGPGALDTTTAVYLFEDEFKPLLLLGPNDCYYLAVRRERTGSEECFAGSDVSQV